jgi:succinate-semialdehyde dehydrogenase/glutarate-semialdehyde dehydrogenase
MREPVPLFIGGGWRLGAAGLLDVVDPATEAPTGQVSLAAAADLDAALATAAAARASWRATPAAERGAVLVKAAQLLRARAAEIARLLTLEQGKTLAESMGEITRAVETLTWNGEEAGRIEGRTIPGRAKGSQRQLVPSPIGVVAAFTAWNFPAVLVTRKLGAALAAGCPVILKAAEEAPYTAAAIVQCLADAGLPTGVLALVFGDPPQVARHLLGSAVVRKITFTGSTRVGKELARLAADDLKRCTFELGGAPSSSAPTATSTAVKSTLAFSSPGGPVLHRAEPIGVHRSRYEAFVEKFAATRALKVGNGLEDGTQMGPVANARASPPWSGSRAMRWRAGRRSPPAGKGSRARAGSGPRPCCATYPTMRWS